MREVTDHLIDTKELGRGELRIWALDEIGPGGARHEYIVEDPATGQVVAKLTFQKGGIQDNGINGVTNEALLAVVIDRLRDFQAGPFPSENNNWALEGSVGALEYLKQRTKERLARGVEGKELA